MRPSGLHVTPVHRHTCSGTEAGQVSSHAVPMAAQQQHAQEAAKHGARGRSSLVCGATPHRHAVVIHPAADVVGCLVRVPIGDGIALRQQAHLCKQQGGGNDETASVGGGRVATAAGCPARPPSLATSRRRGHQRGPARRPPPKRRVVFGAPPSSRAPWAPPRATHGRFASNPARRRLARGAPPAGGTATPLSAAFWRRGFSWRTWASLASSQQRNEEMPAAAR